MIELLIIVDHAVGNSGPHRNVVGTLNALSRRSDIHVTLLTGHIDPNEPYARAKSIRVVQSFDCKSRWKIASQVGRVLMLATRADLIYVPTGLVSSLYAFTAKLLLGKKVVLGPNVTPLPIRAADSPGYVELALMADLWLEASRARQQHVLNCVGERLGGNVKHAQHAIDLQMFTPERRQIGFWARHHLGDETVKVLYVGRDERRKGLIELMERSVRSMSATCRPPTMYLSARCPTRRGVGPQNIRTFICSDQSTVRNWRTFMPIPTSAFPHRPGRICHFSY